MNPIYRKRGPLSAKPFWRTSVLAMAIGASVAVSGGVAANSGLEKFETNYEKGQSASGEAVSNQSRQPLWTNPNIVGMQPDAETLGVRDKERGQSGVNGAGAISSDGLTSFSDRISNNPEYLELYRRVMNLGFTMGEDDYGHEGHIGNLEDRVDALENVPGNWQPGSPEAGGWQPVGSPGISVWSPEISNQEADFTQSRTVSQDVQRTVNVYETNAVTGERRLVDTYTETDTQTGTETRLIDVANNPGGGTDGWSAWQNLGSPDCSSATWLPATSTVNQGQGFTQTRTCSQNQQRFIYYLADGLVLESNRGSRTTNISQSRMATGTKTTLACTYSGPMTSDRTTFVISDFGSYDVPVVYINGRRVATLSNGQRSWTNNGVRYTPGARQDILYSGYGEGYYHSLCEENL